MKLYRKWPLFYLIGAALCVVSITTLREGRIASLTVNYDPVIPRTWDSAAMHDFELPLADPKATPKPISEKFYYQLPERIIYRSYPIYHPDHEPEGYQEWLRNQEPEIVFDPAKLKTEADWIAAGEMLFDHPIDTFGAIINSTVLADPAFYAYTKMPLTAEGIIPFSRYVIGEKGKISVGNLSCGMCHTRVMPGGVVVKGAQGNFPGDKATAYALKDAPPRVTRGLTRILFAAPWIENDPHTVLAASSREDVVAAFAAVPEGAFGRQGTSVLFPPQVQDLIALNGVRARYGKSLRS